MKHQFKQGTALLLVLLLLVPFAPLCAAQTSEKAFPSGLAYGELEDRIEAAFDARGTDNGYMTAVFDAEGTIYEGYFGFANKERGLRMDETTVVDWGSVSKLIVWLSAMQLAERGLLDLNEDIRTYLPKGFLRKLRFDDPITLLHLMNHTAGFEDTTANMIVVARNRLLTMDELLYSSAKPLTLEEYLKKSEPHQIYRPGDTVAYSNYGCALAAYVIECVTGEAFSAYARQNVFVPLGMDNTALSADLSDNPSVQERFGNLWFYNADGSAVKDTQAAAWRVMNCYPAGHCTSTLRDLKTFARALLLRDERLLSAEGFAEFFSPSRNYTGTDVPRSSHGLFWLYSYGVPVVGHNGNTLSAALLLLEPNSGVGFVALANEAHEGVLMEDIPRLLFGSYAGDEGAADYHTCVARWDYHSITRLAYPFACYYRFTKEDFAKKYINVLPNKLELFGTDYFYSPALNRFGVFGYALWVLLTAYKAMPGDAAGLVGLPARQS